MVVYPILQQWSAQGFRDFQEQIISETVVYLAEHHGLVNEKEKYHLTIAEE